RKRVVNPKIHVVDRTIETNADSATTTTVGSGLKNEQITAAPFALTTGAGFIEWLHASVDHFCTWTANKFRKTSIEGDFTFDIKTERGTLTYISKWNQRKINFGDPGTGYCYELSHFSRNPDDTYNWNLWKVPYLFDTNAVEYTYTYHREYPKTFLLKDLSAAGKKQYQDRIHIVGWIKKRKRFSSEAAAWAYVNASQPYLADHPQVVQHQINQYSIEKPVFSGLSYWQDEGDVYEV
ncbi:MAG: hypothetical protein ABIH23_16630, partial [bacterium]